MSAYTTPIPITDNITFAIDNHPIHFGELQNLLDKNTLIQLMLYVRKAQHEVDDVSCPVHGETAALTISISSRTGEFSYQIASCCSSFEEAHTAPLRRKAHQTAYFAPGMRLLLQLKGAKQPFNFEAKEINALVIGRCPPGEDNPLDIDLQHYNGQELGVSRRHAMIVWHKGALHIVDKDSSNGTFVNGERIETLMPHILKHDYTVRLGNLEMQVIILDGAE